MANFKAKIVDGRITFKYRTFDGSYVTDTMSEEEAKPLLDEAKTDPEVPGFELVNGNYHFETDTIVLKLKKSKSEE